MVADNEDIAAPADLHFCGVRLPVPQYPVTALINKGAGIKERRDYENLDDCLGAMQDIVEEAIEKHDRAVIPKGGAIKTFFKGAFVKSTHLMFVFEDNGASVLDVELTINMPVATTKTLH